MWRWNRWTKGHPKIGNRNGDGATKRTEAEEMRAANMEMKVMNRERVYMHEYHKEDVEYWIDLRTILPCHLPSDFWSGLLSFLFIRFRHSPFSFHDLLLKASSFLLSLYSLFFFLPFFSLPPCTVVWNGQNLGWNFFYLIILVQMCACFLKFKLISEAKLMVLIFL